MKIGLTEARIQVRVKKNISSCRVDVKLCHSIFPQRILRLYPTRLSKYQYCTSGAI